MSGPDWTLPPAPDWTKVIAERDAAIAAAEDAIVRWEWQSLDAVLERAGPFAAERVGRSSVRLRRNWTPRDRPTPSSTAGTSRNAFASRASSPRSVATSPRNGITSSPTGSARMATTSASTATGFPTGLSDGRRIGLAESVLSERGTTSLPARRFTTSSL
jgi:hypothetical protein